MLLFATVKKPIITRSHDILRSSVNFRNGAYCIVNNFCFEHFKHFHNSHFKALQAEVPELMNIATGREARSLKAVPDSIRTRLVRCPLSGAVERVTPIGTLRSTGV